ncbi:motility associated factor glycosyltransferase family protein [Paenibacillus sinopodophylli]|uniref:motility associated factor glycosyltransferase family protein n=1 Tax=Paenibacillus sinopodophylli TaxID=1837342 RepID=UPI00110CC779|nr:6-hydroxymethylpterin diphosphokinase MptE-like protein [Paenibacillus sinopodophylli]
MTNTPYPIDEMIEDIRLFLPKLIEACLVVEDLLHAPMTEQSWRQFGDMVEGMDDLYKTLNDIHVDLDEEASYHPMHDSIVRALASIKANFGAMNLSMDQDDYIGASECIRFELIPTFKQLAAEFGDVKSKREQRFAANMQYLKSSYPKVYSQLHIQLIDHRHYHIAYARNGMPTLSISATNGKPMQVYSQFNPVNEAKTWISKMASTARVKSKVLMYGFGYGYHAKEYAQVYSEHSLFLYEPDVQVLLAAMSVIDINSLFESLNIIGFAVGTSKDAVDDMLKSFNQFSSERPNIVVLLVYRKIKAEELKVIYSYAEKAIMDHNNGIYNFKRFGLEWTRNSMYNVKSLLTTPSIAELANKLDGVTAVIVGAGPSLEVDMEYLRKMKEHAFIIAAGTAIQALLHHGIEPHLIVSIDGSEGNYKAFEPLDVNHIPLLFAAMIDYRIIEHREGGLLHVHLKSDSTIEHFMGNRGAESVVFKTTHSVTGTAVQAAIYMGCKEIVFAGQDLSYSGTQVYASGAKHLSEEQNETRIKEATFTVENVQGAMNRTSNGMKAMLYDLEDLLSQYAGIRFVNTTHLGAKIRHTIWEPMEEVLQRLDNSVIQENFFSKELIGLQSYSKKQTTEIYERIAQLPEQLKVCESQCRKIVTQIGLLTGLSRTNAKKCLSTITEIDRQWEIVSTSNPFKGLYMRACRGELKQFEGELSKLNAATTLRDQVIFYRNSMEPLIKTMIDRSAELMAIVIETKQRMEAAIELINLREGAHYEQLS